MNDSLEQPDQYDKPQPPTTTTGAPETAERSSRDQTVYEIHDRYIANGPTRLLDYFREAYDAGCTNAAERVAALTQERKQEAVEYFRQEKRAEKAESDLAEARKEIERLTVALNRMLVSFAGTEELCMECGGNYGDTASCESCYVITEARVALRGVSPSDHLTEVDKVITEDGEDGKVRGVSKEETE